MKKILVVDDMQIYREPIALALRQAGFEVFTAENGLDALKQIELAELDLLLLDISMPVMDGITCLERMRQLKNGLHLPVIMLTALAEKNFVIRAKKFDVREYLVKSYFSLSELIESVKREVGAKPNTDTRSPQSEVPSSTIVAMPLASTNQSQLSMSEKIRGFKAVRALPGVIQEILSLTSSANSSTEKAAKLLAQDPAISVKVLQVANSAAYSGMKGFTSNLDEAVVKLGFSALRDIAAAVGLYELAGESNRENSGLLRCWEHSLFVAELMQAMVPGTDTSSRDIGYLVGLYHDLPEFILRQEFGQELESLLIDAQKLNIPWEQQMATSFGVEYQEFADLVLSQLGVPTIIKNPIIEFSEVMAAKKHLSPSRSVEGLLLANSYANSLFCATSSSACVAPIRLEAMRRAWGKSVAPEINFDQMRTTVRDKVFSMAKLSPTQQSRLVKPLLSKRAVRIGYMRPKQFSSSDPLELALGGLAEISVGSDLQVELLANIQGLVVIGSLGNQCQTTPADLRSCFSAAIYSKPVLLLVAEPDEMESLGNLTVCSYPISVDMLSQWVALCGKLP